MARRDRERQNKSYTPSNVNTSGGGILSTPTTTKQEPIETKSRSPSRSPTSSPSRDDSSSASLSSSSSHAPRVPYEKRFEESAYNWRDTQQGNILSCIH